MIGLSDDQNVKKLIRHFHDLEVYKKSFAVSLDIHRTSLGFPKIEQYALGDQIRRASKSICANIAEGFAKQQSSKPDFKRFLLIAIGSAHEMLVWIEYCRELGYVPEDQAQQWANEYQTVTRMLQSLHSKI
jgi:four helix bundle protein